MRRHSMTAITLLVVAALSLTACANFAMVQGSGNVIRENREVAAFSAIDICCGMRLEFTQGEPVSVELEGDDNILAEIETVVRDDVLIIQFRQRLNLWTNTRTPLVAYVTAPTLNGLEVSGGGAANVPTLNGERLQLTLSGGSHADLAELQLNELNADLSGGARATIQAGTVDNQQIDASGGSHYLADDLASGAARLEISGGSRARIWVSDELTVDASGGSNVAYYGRPLVNQDSSGGSRIDALGERE